ncbi:MAG TPA: DNA repair protein RecN [Bacillota bacterium]|nr:DNA repair protein RecN [Candidatus Fermentithermobacillaceae bacterium]HOK64498.1 DNA repair protein RecN [Bacillota bacterium]HOL11784.1 DNA repair protein RecN [Bacillota bacterium]HOQ02302.1 DNA repair protein RecN [Bacillota bacterium]HPP60833.1 DNA repair protein RecN [Bacillota bacterium]
MLTYLRIQNFGIFRDVEIELGPGLTVFTGETGAGKSMIVDAVMACLGYRTSPEVIRAGEERAILELFISPEGDANGFDEQWEKSLGEGTEVAIQRDILPERSYMRINGRIATMSMAQSIGEKLVDIHGQQEHYSLLRAQNYISMIDSMNKQAIAPLKSKYYSHFSRRQELIQEKKDLSTDQSAREREIDLLAYQIAEIDKAALCIGEDEVLRQEYRVLNSQRKLINLSNEVYGSIYDGVDGTRSAYELITQAIELLKEAADIDPAAEGTKNALEQVSYALEVAVDLLREYQKGLSLEPGRLQEVQERLDLIEKLKSKYGGTIEDVLKYKGNAEERLKHLLNASEILEKLDEELAAIENEMASIGRTLTQLRREAATKMEESISDVLEELGMPGAKFIVQLEHQEDAEDGVLVDGVKIRPFQDGFDKATFLFSANPGEPALPLQKVASGGELSRLMLAIKSCVEEVDPVPTLIFDEIDAGVGGRAGQAIGEKLWQLGRTHQVLCVTHLASIAAMADSHFVVTKTEGGGRTYGQVIELKDQESRAKEIARMLSGAEVGASLAHGRELLLKAEDYKNSFKNS